MSGNQQNRGTSKVIRLIRGRPNVQNRLKQFKSNDNQTGNSNTKPLLRTKQQLIAKNLSTLKENVRKKQLAQKLYYQNNSNNRSPLIRQNPQIQNNCTIDNRPSVHKRLGRRNVQNNFVVNKNTNPKNMIINKNQQARQNKAQKVVNLKRKFNKNRFNNSPNNYLQNNNQQKTIILRRARPRTSNINPMNYTVQVNNNAESIKHHNELNPRLQAEIKMIQRNNHVHEIVQAMPLHPPGAGVTKRSLNERFSHL